MSDELDPACSIRGDENSLVTRRELNDFMRHILIAHVRPMKQANAQLAKAVEGYIAEDRETHAKLQGGLRLILPVMSILAVLCTTIIGIALYAYQTEIKGISQDIQNIEQQVAHGILPIAKQRMDLNDQAMKDVENRLREVERKR